MPTIAEQGLPAEIIQWFGVFGPPGLPKPIVEKLNAEINAIIKQPDVVEKIESQGGTIYRRHAAEFADYIRTDSAKWDKLVKSAGIKLD